MMIVFEEQALFLLLCQTFEFCCTVYLSFNVVLLVQTSPVNLELHSAAVIMGVLDCLCVLLVEQTFSALLSHVHLIAGSQNQD